MYIKTFMSLAIHCIDDFLYGRCPRPVQCGKQLEIGAGMVVPEINFTLPAIEITEDNWEEICRQYRQMGEEVCRRAVELEIPGLLMELETLPPMTVRPAWGIEITRILAETINRYHERHGIRVALRLTPNDTRDHVRPPLMRRGVYWDGMVEMFQAAGEAGADLLAIESTGGKEICDEALTEADLRTVVFALGVLAARDMQFLWKEMVGACRQNGVVPSGDSACGFANTAMILADQKYIPKVFAAVIRAASVPRSLIAFEMGAVGPGKDCAYEGPFIKAITGAPISMEGRTAACAHLSAIGNIAQAVCDCWSNESVQNVRLLSAYAPVVSLEQLAYDCRLMNTAKSRSLDEARLLRDWLVESDAARDPQAYILRPDVVLRLSQKIMEEESAYRRTVRAVREAIGELKEGHRAGALRLAVREVRWLERLEKEAAILPEDEERFLEEILKTPAAEKFMLQEYEF